MPSALNEPFVELNLMARFVGPGMPYLDAALKPVSVLSQYLKQPGTLSIGQGQLTWAPADALSNIVLPAPEYQCDQPLVEVIMLRRDGTNLLTLANSSGADLESTLTFTGTREFRSVWCDAPNKSGQGRATFATAAYSIQIWEVV